MSTGTEDLLVNILRDMPRLPGAAYRGRARQFELLAWGHPDRDQHARAAQDICRHHCPALDSCRMLLDGLDDPPIGMVMAGRIVTGTSLSRKAGNNDAKAS